LLHLVLLQSDWLQSNQQISRQEGGSDEH